MNRRVSLFRWDALELDKVTEMIARKVIPGVNEKLAQTYFKKGALVPQHSHAGEQMIYVLQGALRIVADGGEFTVREGEVLVVPAGVPHQSEALDDTFVMDALAIPASGDTGIA